MKTYTLRCLLFVFAILAFCPVRASHIIGGGMTYQYLGDSVSAATTYSKYKVSLVIYEDCLNGSPQAIAQDNPAFLGVFYAVTGGNYKVYELDTFTQGPNAIYFSSMTTIPAVFANSCGSSTNQSICTIKKTFVKTYAFPPSSTGYTISYQRCCRNARIANLFDPSNTGFTISCAIPPTSVNNSSAIFKNEPPQLACLNQPFYYDNSATDADGDSLTYGFATSLNGANNSSNSKPDPLPPPYDTTSYILPWSSSYPISSSPAIAINPVTGIITGTPNIVGRYLVDVYCDEWRAGQLINKVTREFELVVTNCNENTFILYAGPDTTVLAGNTVQFFASPAATYSWSPSTNLSNPNIANPVGTYNEPGYYYYTLYEVSDSGCTGERAVEVQVLDYSNFTVPNAFSPNGDNVNDVFNPVPVLGSTLISLRVFDRKGILVYNGGELSRGWDGTYKGVKQDVGTYFWELLYYDNKHATRHMKGDVVLIR